MIGDRHVNGHDRVAAQRRRHRRLADLPVRRIRHDDDVGRQLVAVRVQEGREGRGSDLFLALDEDNDVDGQVSAQDRQRAQVDDYAGAVIGGAATVDAIATHLGLVGVHAPAVQLAHGLDVVVGVQEDGRRALNAGSMSHDGRLALRAIGGLLTEDLRLQAQGLETLAQVLGAALQVGGVRRVRRHRRNRDQLGELIEQGRESGLEALPQNGHRQFV